MNLYFNNLTKYYGDKVVFENIRGKLNEGERVGLIGINGCGKTTLLKMIFGVETFDSGSMVISPENIIIKYINNQFSFNEHDTPYNELYLSCEKENIKDLKIKLEKALHTVGLNEDLWNQGISSLSGGEKSKLQLCKIFLSNFDILLLDEPTNHLDMESIKWLEEFLIKINKTMIIVSHDRYFLDRVTNRIWEMTDKGVKIYKGNYSDYKLQRDNEIKHINKEYDKQQSEIRHLKEVINERENWFQSAHKSAGQNDFYRSKAKKHVSVMRAKEKQLEKLENNKVEKPREVNIAAFNLINKALINEKLPKYLIQVKGLNKGFGKNIIFNKTSFYVMRGEKASLLGRNGSGKTTLLKIINGFDNDYDGTLSINPSVRIGYFAQELDNLNMEKSILDEVLMEGTTKDEARLMLACLLFKGEDVYKRVEVLSMGEKCRVALAKLILSGANLLILDEPTNYLDIFSRERIEEVLREYKGTILLVSHDRYFIRSISSKILEIENRSIKSYDGDYEYYKSKKENEKISNLIGNEYKNLQDNMSKLECEIAYLSGKLDENLEYEEREMLNKTFITKARELNGYKQKLKELK